MIQPTILQGKQYPKWKGLNRSSALLEVLFERLAASTFSFFSVVNKPLCEQVGKVGKLKKYM